MFTKLKMSPERPLSGPGMNKLLSSRVWLRRWWIQGESIPPGPAKQQFKLTATISLLVQHNTLEQGGKDQIHLLQVGRVGLNQSSSLWHASFPRLLRQSYSVV